MIKGEVILVPFPFTDLTGLKNRPALVLLATEYDITVAFISTQIKRASSLGDTVPGILQLGAVFFEVIGGLAFLLGLFSPIVSLGTGITMFVAVIFHIVSSDPIIRLTVKGSSEGPGTQYLSLPEWFVLANGRSAVGSGSAELALLFLFISICLFYTGAGKYSLDYVGGRIRKPD